MTDNIIKKTRCRINTEETSTTDCRNEIDETITTQVVKSSRFLLITKDSIDPESIDCFTKKATKSSLPDFSTKHKELVLESWHYAEEHLAEVIKMGHMYNEKCCKILNYMSYLKLLLCYII